jgi:hypothetical protein
MRPINFPIKINPTQKIKNKTVKHMERMENGDTIYNFIIIIISGLSPKEYIYILDLLYSFHDTYFCHPTSFLMRSTKLSKHLCPILHLKSTNFMLGECFFPFKNKHLLLK